MWASLGGVGFTAGVLIGGLLTSGPGWRWVFFINVPVGIVLVAAIRALVPLRRHPDRTARLDVLGAVTVTGATGLFIYGMLNAGEGAGPISARCCPSRLPSSCTACSWSSNAPYRRP